MASSLYGGLPTLIQHFRKTYPNIRLQFLELTSAGQLEALRSGRIDLGFGRIRLHDPSIARIIYREERLALAMANTHPLAQDIHYRLIDDPDISSPIIFSYRKNDNSWYIEAMQELVQNMYAKHPELFEQGTQKSLQGQT